jgi:hypothetical protein
MYRFAVYAASAALLLGLSQQPAAGCPFCPPQSQTLSERLALSDVAVLAQWVDARRGADDSDDLGSSTYKIVQELRSTDQAPGAGERVALPRYRAGRAGDLYFLTGRMQDGVLNWDEALEISEIGFHYIAQAPSIETPTAQRLGFFAKFLEFPDPLIANDAFAEFGKAPYEDVAPLARKMPREKVRRWLISPETPAVRLGLYGMMLGLCGTEEDARLLEEIITEPAADFRAGIDGVIAGYLLLTGDQGLELIEQTKLRDETAATSETYAAMQALRFLWTYAEGQIEKNRLRQSMRSLLDRPSLAELAITDLARWQDWSIQDRLMAIYNDPEYDDPRIKLAVIRFLLVGVHADSAEGEPSPAHVKKGREYLDELRKRDPHLVRRAESLTGGSSREPASR